MIRRDIDMVMRSERMSHKDIREAYSVGIPREIISKMTIGKKLTEKEKGIVREYGKTIVESHTKLGRGKLILVRPQLRDLPRQ